MSKKLTLDEVRLFFTSNNCELLEEEYINARTNMKYKCICGNISSIKFYNFKGGKRCRKCGTIRCHDKQKHSYNKIYQFFKNHGCLLLETEYVNARTLMKYQCACEQQSTIRYSDFKRGMRCRNCYINRIKGENHHCWKPDREEYNKSVKFKKRCHSLLNHTLKVFSKAKQECSHILLGYSPKDLQNYITSHPNWENVKDGQWHIDHIFPISAFFKKGIYDIKLINHFDNLQPLISQDNLTKHAKYNEDEFNTWLDNHQN